MPLPMTTEFDCDDLLSLLSHRPALLEHLPYTRFHTELLAIAVFDPPYFSGLARFLFLQAKWLLGLPQFLPQVYVELY
jgi:hypothetical protein